MSPERRKLLEDLRLRQVLAEAKLTPHERLLKAEGLREFAAIVGPGSSPRCAPVELLVRLRRERIERFGRAK